jgi:hypothetical protein
MISNVTFTTCLGGWQGGALSINGRGMDIKIMNSKFTDCESGTTHKRDGKGGAIAVCGGIQCPDPPMNDVRIEEANCL